MMHLIKHLLFRKKLGVFSLFFSSIIIMMLGLILLGLASESNATSQSLNVAGALEKKRVFNVVLTEEKPNFKIGYSTYLSSLGMKYDKEHAVYFSIEEPIPNELTIDIRVDITKNKEVRRSSKKNVISYIL